MFDISVGDRFYFNSNAVRRKLALPDYFRITKLISLHEDEQIDYIEAKPENRGTYTREKLYSPSILIDSNLNPNMSNPSWIFVKENNNDVL